MSLCVCLYFRRGLVVVVVVGDVVWSSSTGVVTMTGDRWGRGGGYVRLLT